MPQKRWPVSTRLHGLTFQKTAVFSLKEDQQGAPEIGRIAVCFKGYILFAQRSQSRPIKTGQADETASALPLTSC